MHRSCDSITGGPQASVAAGNGNNIEGKKGVFNMVKKMRSGQSGFTLVEIMIVVAIIGLLATLGLPSMMKARKQAQGRRTMNDVRQLAAAIDQWALEFGKKDGDMIDTNAAASYVKPNCWETTDPLGHAYVLNSVGTTQIQIAATTKSALAGVGIDWGAY